jgi:transcriptional regulator with XRE-family HTH domain
VVVMVVPKSEKLLEDWNNGVFRGSQVKLARKIGVDDSTISAWLNGHSKPAVDKIRKLSEILNVSEKDIQETFNIKNKNAINNINPNNNVHGNITQTISSVDVASLKKELEITNEKLKAQEFMLKLILEKLKDKK